MITIDFHNLNIDLNDLVILAAFYLAIGSFAAIFDIAWTVKHWSDQ